MSSDRELLEQAAKVAGINGVYYPVGLESEGLGCHDPELGFFTWNPLSSDGDALRLAVALRIAVSQFSSACAAQRPGWPLFTEDFKGDNCRATRRVCSRCGCYGAACRTDKYQRSSPLPALRYMSHQRGVMRRSGGTRAFDT